MHQYSNTFTCSKFLTLALSFFLLISVSTSLHAKEKLKEAEQSATTEEIVATLEKHTKTAEEIELEKKQVEEQRVQNIKKVNMLRSAFESLRIELESGNEISNITRTKVSAIKEGFVVVEKQIQDILNTLDVEKNKTNANKGSTRENKKELASLLRETRASMTDISTQKSLIEDNSIRLYELLVKVSSINEALRSTSKSAVGKHSSEKAVELTVMTDLSRLWILLSILIVSLAPVTYVFSSNRNQFPELKDGTPHHQGIILVCIGAFLSYVLVGFGLMYGTSASGWIGLSSYILESGTINIETKIPFVDFLLFQAGFIMFAALIVYTAVGKQLSASSHMLLAAFVGAILIPIFGHWVWSEQFIQGNQGWLESIGFIDQSGAVVINIIAAWFAFIIIWKLGTSDKPENNQNLPSNFSVYSASATLFLWLSWQGFTTGLLPISDGKISLVMLNNGLAATAGGMMAFLHYIFFHTGKEKIGRGLSGFVSGLVAISSCSQSVTFAEAIAIGAIAGIIQNIAFTFLQKNFLKADSQIPAAYIVSIHGVSGIWGALCVALLGTEGNFSAPNSIQLTTQVEGIVIALIYSMVLGHLVFIFFRSRLRKQALNQNASDGVVSTEISGTKSQTGD